MSTIFEVITRPVITEKGLTLKGFIHAEIKNE